MYTLLYTKEMDAILREGIRGGLREFNCMDEVKYTFVTERLHKLKEMIKSKSQEVQDIFTVSDGYLIGMPDGESHAKVFMNNQDVLGVILYKDGLSYRLFRYERSRGYSVTVIDCYRVLGESFVREKAAPYF